MHDAKLIKLNPQLNVLRLAPEQRVGLVVVLTGHGKGKTSSAMGMVLRACGHGMKVAVIQFMKGDIYSGEWDGILKLDCRAEIVTAGMGFCGIQGNPYPHGVHRLAAQRALSFAQTKVESGSYDLIVLDEINNALKLRLLDLDQVLHLIRVKPRSLHLILTGRDAAPEVIEVADTVSEVQEIRHAYRKGLEPQPGIDY